MSHKFCVSEADAKTKICPHLPVDREVEGNPIHDGPVRERVVSFAKCLGSECMAWRFVVTNINDGKGGPMEQSGDTHGYCGMAGAPWSRP